VSLSEKIDTTTAAGKMVFRMLAVLAEFERDQVSERTTAAMQHKKARQEYTGGAAPYGWRVTADGVSLELDHAEQRVLRTARTLRANGASLRQIGEHLTACGLRQRNGREFRHPEMIKMLLTAAAA
jgi:site-specific DNA recombinase